jgi:DNA-binding MarR family transcriptional regulator
MEMSGESADRETSGVVLRLRLDEFLPYKINILAEKVREPLVRHHLARHEIGVPEWRITMTLAHHGVLTAKDLCRIAHMHKTKVSRALALLESRALVAREANMSDLRESFVSLTPDGFVLYEQLAEAAAEYDVRLRHELSENERVGFEAMLSRLQARADALGREMERAAR